jgi:hypothetical protein
MYESDYVALISWSLTYYLGVWESNFAYLFFNDFTDHLPI